MNAGHRASSVDAFMQSIGMHSKQMQMHQDAHNTYKTFAVPISTVACDEFELRGADGLVRGGERKSVELDRD